MINHTFKDTGITVRLRKVSPLLVIKLQESFPAPKPPMQEVMLGDEKRIEPNPSHPDYVEALTQHQAEMNARVTSLLIRRGVYPDWNEEKQKEVEEIKTFWKETYGRELDGTPLEIYVSYVAIGSDKDLEELLDAILKRSQPTEGAIAQAQERFPGDL